MGVGTTSSGSCYNNQILAGWPDPRAAESEESSLTWSWVCGWPSASLGTLLYEVSFNVNVEATR